MAITAPPVLAVQSAILKRSSRVHVPISPSCWQAHIIAILSSRMDFWVDLSASEHETWAAA